MAEDEGFDREYESAVADVLAHVIGDRGDVQRRVFLPGYTSETKRQIDVLVVIPIPGMPDLLVVVDGKRRGRKVTVPEAQAFIGLVEDVRAGMGLLVSSAGMSKKAKRTFENSRGMLVEHVPIDELERWRPPGTRSVTFAVLETDVEAAQRAFRKAGLRTASETHRCEPGETCISAFRHYKRGAEENVNELAGRALAKAGIVGRTVSSGVVIQGGTPQSAWLEVTISGVPTGVKVLAEDEESLNSALDAVRKDLGLTVPLEEMGVVRPPDWPTDSRTFGIS